MRLDKYLAMNGFGTRSEVKKLIKSGVVEVQGKTVTDADFKLSVELLEREGAVRVQGREVCYKEHRYYMLNKPAGVVTATRDSDNRTVMDLFPFSPSEKRKLFPAGRLDIDTEGLLLITDDGELAHRLLSPKGHVDKSYFALIQGIVTEEDVRRLNEGLELSFQTLPAKLEILSVDEEKNESRVRVTIQEGKYHQIKRMFGAVGKRVIYLKRLSFGRLVLDESLGSGEYRELTKNEIREILGVDVLEK